MSIRSIPTFKRPLRIAAIVTNALCIGWLFHAWLTDTISLLNLTAFPAFLVTAIIALFVPSETFFGSMGRTPSGAALWVGSMIMTICFTWFYVYIKNLPPVLYSVQYFWEEHIQFDFRKNGTYKVIHRDMVNASISYGHYKKVDSLIILQDDVQFGMSNLKDTLMIHNQGITFKLDHPWEGISQATMPFR